MTARRFTNLLKRAVVAIGILGITIGSANAGIVAAAGGDWVDATAEPAGWDYLGSDAATGGTEFSLTPSTGIGNSGATGFSGLGVNNMGAILGDNVDGNQYEIWNDGDVNHGGVVGTDLLMHPDNSAAGRYVIARYTLSVAGTATISGGFHGTKGARIGSVYHNGAALYTSADTTPDRASTGAFNTNATVAIGDTISFVLDSGGNYAGDETSLRATIDVDLPGAVEISQLDAFDIGTDAATLSAELSGTDASVTAYWEAGTVGDPAAHTGWDGTNGPAAESTGTVQRAATGLTADTLYSYAFFGTNDTSGSSDWSTVETFATDLTGAQSPQFTNATALNGASIELGWRNNASNLTGFILQRSSDGGSSYPFSTNLPPATTSYRDNSGLSELTTYHYQLAATNSSNGSVTTFSLARTNATTTTGAPELTYAGTHDSMGSAWRTAATVKPLDLDGNNVLGTDGYYVRNNLRSSQPEYVASSWHTGSGYNHSGYADIDDPDVVPPGTATITVGTSNPTGDDIRIFSFVLGGTVPGRFRVGVMMDGLDAAQYNPGEVYMQEIGGGAVQSSKVDTTGGLYNDTNPDWIFFDVIDFPVGSEVGVYASRGVQTTATLQAFAFDSAVPPRGTMVTIR